jgi:glycosyltransferase involved in cell wall biosynthesis
MILGTLIGYSRRRFTMSAGLGYGKLVAHEELTKALLRHHVVSGVHVFSQSLRSAVMERERRECDAGIEEAFSADEARPVFRPLADFPATVGAGDYTFLSAGPETQRLGQMRAARSPLAFPITTIVHSVNWFDLLAFYLAMLATSSPYDALVTTSTAADTAVRRILDWLRTAHGATSDMRIERIPLGVDADTIGVAGDGARAHARASLGFETAATIVLYTGRLTDEFKADLEPLVAAIARLTATDRTIRLVVAGQDRDGDGYAARVRLLARGAGIGSQVTVIENPSEVVKHLLYDASDVFVSPADNVQESFGITLLEAMAHGLPVVATDWSGYRDIVDDRVTGLLVPCYWDAGAADRASLVSPADLTTGSQHYMARHTVLDSDALFTHLHQLVHDAALRRRFGAAGRARVERDFSWRVVAERYRHLFADQQAMRARMADVRKPALSLDAVFAHYATAALDDALIVCGTPYGENLVRPLQTLSTVRPMSRVDRLLARLVERPATVGELRKELSADEWEAAIALLKAGRLRLAPPPARAAAGMSA